MCIRDSVPVVNSLSSTTHVRRFNNHLATVSNQLFCIFFVQLVLDSARECDVAFYFPRFTFREEFSTEFLGVRSYNVIVASTQFQHVVYTLSLIHIFFLADSIYWERDWGKIQYNYRVNGNALIIGGMNANLTAMDAATKKARKNELLGATWDYYIAVSYTHLT